MGQVISLKHTYLPTAVLSCIHHISEIDNALSIALGSRQLGAHDKTTQQADV